MISSHMICTSYRTHVPKQGGTVVQQATGAIIRSNRYGVREKWQGIEMYDINPPTLTGPLLHSGHHPKMVDWMEKEYF
jgi:hypothetical protein